MIKQNEAPPVEQFVNQTESQESVTQAIEPGKKAFVEPEISVPVDVLEATTFFQAITSGPA